MYNPQKIIKLRDELQAEITLLLEKYEPLINSAISAQIPSNHKLYAGMGSCSAENKDGKEVGELFCSIIQPLMYVDAFETGISINSVNV